MGRRAVVMGGGPSLMEDLKILWNPGGGLLGFSPIQKDLQIAVNYHALVVGFRPQYMVYNDHPDSDPLLLRAVMDFEGTCVSPDPSSEIEFDVAVWTGFYSSNTATWFALWLGCDPVVLCGMDCYQGERVYCHDYSHDSPAFHYPLDDHLRPWYEEGMHKLPHVERVQVMSGPLQMVFPLYSPPARCALRGGQDF